MHKKPAPLTREQSALIAANVGLAIAFARQYPTPLIDLDDRVQIATCGLISAVQAWDPTRGALSTIAHLCMRGAMRRAMVLARRQSADESLDAPIDEEATDLHDSLSADVPATDAATLRRDDAEHAYALVAGLSADERAVVSQRFGLDGQQPATNTTVGAAIGASRETARRLEARALARLRKAAKRTSAAA